MQKDFKKAVGFLGGSVIFLVALKIIDMEVDLFSKGAATIYTWLLGK